MGDTTRGLYRKFHVERTNGSSQAGKKHDGCCYFVLDLDHDAHARPALEAYANSCEGEYPALAADLRNGQLSWQKSQFVGAPRITESDVDTYNELWNKRAAVLKGRITELEAKLTTLPQPPDDDFEGLVNKYDLAVGIHANAAIDPNRKRTLAAYQFAIETARTALLTAITALVEDRDELAEHVKTIELSYGIRTEPTDGGQG